MVIQQRTQKVVCRRNGVHIPGKMEVDILHGHGLRIAAARGAALDAEHRAQRGLAQGEHGLFPDFGHGLPKAHGGGRLPLTCRRGIDRRHKHQLAVRTALQPPECVIGELGLILPVQVDLFGPKAQF